MIRFSLAYSLICYLQNVINMTPFTKTQAIIFHLYPGIAITLGMLLIIPAAVYYGFPPQFGMLIAIIFIALPVLMAHLLEVKKRENKTSVLQLNGFTKRLPAVRLILYSIALVIFSFITWGLIQPLNNTITEKIFHWVPSYFTTQSYEGYSKNKVLITLIINLLINGLLAPYVEELYFRGYLLSRMKKWGKYAFVANAILFSLYHFWQATIYLTLIISLLPMTYLVSKTKDVRIAILTHSLLNIVGALLSFGALNDLAK